MWNTQTLDSKTIHTAEFSAMENADLKLAIESCAALAITLLEENIKDDSLYLLFEWNPLKATLTVALTDAKKQSDAPHTVIGTFSTLSTALTQPNHFEKLEQSSSYTESVKFWLYDYLTTSTGFLNYSLVAIFHSSTRSNAQLL